MPSDRGPLRRYGFALVAAICAGLLTPPLSGYLEPMPGALFGIAVLASAWYGGVGPGFGCFLLMAVIVNTLYPPQPPPTAKSLAGLSFVILITFLLGWQSSASRRARAALRFLADAGKLLAGSLDSPTTLSTVARLTIPELADGCVIDLLGPDGSLGCAAAAHAYPLAEQKLRRAATSQAPSLDAPRGAAEVVRTGQPVLYGRLTASLLRDVVRREARRQALQGLRVRSLMIVPLRAHGRTLGTMTLFSSRLLRRYDRAALALAVELGQRAGLAIDNARLYGEAREMEEALRRRAEQLAAADQHKDEFLAVVAHELRGPLAALRTALEVLRLHGPVVPLADAPQGIMTRQVDTLARLVDDLLDLAGIAQGKVALRRQAIELAAVLRAATDTARPLLDGQRHTLTITLPREQLLIDGDPLRLEQVFINLLTNAAKYTDPGGHVWVSAALEASSTASAQAVVSVRDTGVGMDPDFLTRAFDLFAQETRAPADAPRGLGIGLALVRRLVELHGGTVEAHSDGPGRGSEFVVRLPVSKDLAPAPKEKNGTAGGAAPCRRVLVVDDNADAAESLALLLRLRGHDVHLAPDGPAALALAGQCAPDVVLLDLGLPGMDGHEVGRRLRLQPGLDKALVVALTGSGTEDDRRLSREAGFDHHVVKPIDPEELDRLLAGR
jgi:signal transduction histidine kinase